MATTNLSRMLHEKHQYRLVLCGHKAVEAGAVCLLHTKKLQQQA